MRTFSRPPHARLTTLRAPWVVLWRTIGALLLGAAVAIGVANLVIAIGGAEPRRPPAAVELVPTGPDIIGGTTVPPTSAPPPTDPAGSPNPSIVVPPTFRVEPAPAPAPTPAPAPRPPAPPPADDDDGGADDLDDLDDLDDVDEVDDD